MIKAKMRYGSAESAEKAKGGTGTTNITNVSATANTLAPGSSSTVSAVLSANSLAFTFGIPEGDEGQEGPEGPIGPTGNGIASIAKTGTVGLVDTYTITYTNGQTTTFTVTNGQDGSGDMEKSVYDTDNDGYVDAVEDQEDPGNGIEFSLDANGKGQYRAVGASTWIPFLSGGGGPTYTRLWTNSSPSATFAAQDATLSESAANFDYLRIVWARVNTAGITESNWASSANALSQMYDMTYATALVDATNTMQMGASVRPGTGYYSRRCWFTSTACTTLSFGATTRWSSSGTNNGLLIPILVDGVKF